ncbi:MAG: TerB family tellurite resistance protein [Candidatus Cloacimonadota bacterium]|nr:TerB family tellurite resistance protein [Candidatus Cloacimonadota bacterium]
MNIKNIFSFNKSNTTAINTVDQKDKIEIATCALLLEIAKADDQFTKEEEKIIQKILQKKFTLNYEEIKELISQSEKVIDESIDLWQFTNKINEYFSRAEKLLILESAWEIIYSDDKLDVNEDYLIHKFTNLLRLDHKDLIQTKLKVKNNE